MEQLGSRVDLVEVGAGIVGLAVARAFSEDEPDLRICVIDKEAGIARHQTGRNSGVIHAGLYSAGVVEGTAVPSGS